jgi:hypothetical protein
MAQHAQLKIDTSVYIYFCDPIPPLVPGDRVVNRRLDCLTIIGIPVAAAPNALTSLSIMLLLPKSLR